MKNSKAELSEVVDILEGCLNIRFKDYIGVLNFNNKKNLNNVLSFSMYKKKHLLTSAHCHFSWIQPLEGGRDSKAIFDSKLKFFFERKILSLGCEIGEFFGVREQTLSWLRFVDTEYLKKFFYPFDFEVSLNGEYDLKKIHLILQKMKTDRLQYAKDFFRKKSSIFSIFTDSFVVDCIESLAQLMFTQKIILKTSFSNQGKAKAIVHLKQDIEQKDISSLHVNFNLEWGTLLKYFEEKSPESYNKAYKFLSDALSTINKNKDLSNIDTEVILRYKHNKENLILESLLVNDLSIPQLIQRYFFNKGISNTLKNIR
ncbi:MULTISPECIES: hypothetical protein [Holospora]|uniref:hypothetical protein n=1 Tax=Holospora TaxID=44747 RepID=UPI0012696196|nr:MULTISPECIES: hypothetical protein [Holospora]